MPEFLKFRHFQAGGGSIQQSNTDIQVPYTKWNRRFLVIFPLILYQIWAIPLLAWDLWFWTSPISHSRHIYWRTLHVEVRLRKLLQSLDGASVSFWAPLKERFKHVFCVSSNWNVGLGSNWNHIFNHRWTQPLTKNVGRFERVSQAQKQCHLSSIEQARDFPMLRRFPFHYVDELSTSWWLKCHANCESSLQLVVQREQVM